jgi:putative Ca2+/H+ antiporter (TMEM165/GDT1 family)
MIYTAITADDDDEEEKEVQQAIEEHETAENQKYQLMGQEKKKSFASEYLFIASLLVCQELGDKSQITAIALGSTYSVWGVLIGGALGFTTCNLVAVLIGKALKSYIKPTTIYICGGLLFLAFGCFQLWSLVTDL